MKVGKIYTVKDDTGEEMDVYYMGGPKNKASSFKKLSAKEKMYEATMGTGYNEEDLPEFRELIAGGSPGMFSDAGLSLASMMFSSGDVEKMKQAVVQVDPNARFGQDLNGKVYADFVNPSNGQESRAYLDKPGFSSQDVMQGIGEFGTLLGAGKLLGVGRQGVSMVGNALRAGGAGAVGSIARDITSNLTGGRSVVDSTLGEGAVDLQRAATEGALEAAATGLFDLLPIILPPIRQMVQRGTRIVTNNGEPTKELRRMLEEVGVKWEETSQAWRDELVERAMGGGTYNAREAAILAEANSLPGPDIPLTRGSVTGMPGDQLYEDQMRKGIYGEDVAMGMRQFDDSTRNALNQNQLAIQEQIADGAPIVDRNQGAELVQATLAGRRQGEKTRADAFYDEARELGSDAQLIPGPVNASTITPVNLQTFFDQMSKRLSDEFLQSDLGGANQLLKDLEGFAAAETGPDIALLFKWRQKLNKGQPGSDDAAARRIMKTEFDNFLAKALDNELIGGRPEAVAAWKDAISNYKDFADTWLGGDLVDKLTRTRQGANGSELVVAPADAANFIFNSSNLGFMNKRDLQRDIVKMRDLLPAEDFNYLRQELFLRMMDAGRTGSREISGAKTLSAIEKVFNENSAVLNAAFSGDEISMIRQFGRIADRATNTARNNSNSGIIATKNFNDMLQNISRMFAVKGKLLENFMMRVPVVGSTLMSEQRARFNVPTPGQGYQGVPARTGPAIPAAAATLMNQDVNVTDFFNQDQQALMQ